MPRKKQIVQKQRRQKVYRPGEWSGEATHVKRSGVFKLFSNYRLFALIGVVAIGAGLLFAAFYQGDGGANSDIDIRGEGVIRSTPEAGATSETGAATTIKEYAAPPEMVIDPTKSYTATFKTDQGEFTVSLNAAEAPATVNNFVFLARDGFYDGSTFFRVIPGNDGASALAQAGDPTGTGLGGPGYTLPFEQTDTSFSPGVLAMAKPTEAGAPNNGSQFFISLIEEPTWDGRFTAFGTVTEGLSVVQNLPQRDPQAGENLPPGARIESITITES
jgi:cyclophilin family peptidyl-prolyl cis-trans isomerase